MKRNIIISACCVLCALFCFPLRMAALEGEGTEDSPYLISSVDDWNELADLEYDYPLEYVMDDDTEEEYYEINEDAYRYIKLTADINATGVTLTSLELLYGELDGNNKSIKGISYSGKYYSGPINEIWEGSYVHDLSVYGDITCTSSGGSGFCSTIGIFDSMYYEMMEEPTDHPTTTISNINVYVNTTATCGNIAGFCGSAYYTNFTNCYSHGAISSTGSYVSGFVINESGCNFTDCGNYGDITLTRTSSTCYAAGFVAQGDMEFYSEASSTYTRCFNAGNITAESTGYIGGFAYTLYGNNDYPIYFTDCYNSGNITSYGRVAGFLTYVNRPFEMTGCYNTGNVTNTKSSDYCGGLFAVANIASLTCTDCWNSGTISGPSYAGGIAAYSMGELKMTGCYNTGDVTSSGRYVGGLMGLTNSIFVSGCWNTGNITGSYLTGGIVGSTPNSYSRTDVYISDSWNAGSITSAGYGAGGIAGSALNSVPISGCFNVGTVTSESTDIGTEDTNGYAIGGIVGYGTCSITDVYNAGTVTGATDVGGIIGYNSSATITNAYNMGVISSVSTDCGNISGTDAETMKNAYYLDTKAVSTDGTALTYSELAKLSLGDSWTAGDDYTYPRIAAVADNDYAVAYAAAVVPAGTDTYDYISGDFYVGAPDGVAWTADPDVVTVEGNKASFTEKYSGEFTMTATAGDVSVSTTLNSVPAEDIDLGGIKTIEKFEEMTAFTGDATDVVGVFTNWDFSGANVIETDGTNGLDTQAAAIYGGGALTSMTYAIRSDTIHGISFKAWNANDAAATLHVSYSSDWGTTWTETYALEETAASTVASGASEDAYVYSMELLDTAILLKISVDTEIGEGYITIDDLTVYSGTALTTDIRLTLSGDGTSDSPYIINNVEEWNSLATYISHMSDDLSGEYVLIASDIDFTDATIQPLSSFGGDLDGGGKSISNIALETSVSPAGGLINTATATASIHDLSVSGTLTSSGRYSGGVVGALYGSISNVSGSVDVSSSLSHVGGVVGVSYESAIISGCSNSGDVTSSTLYSGGIVGATYGSSTISGCSNSGDVTSSDLYVGGIVGASYPTTSLTLVENSVNTGSVTYTGTSVTSGVAGIIGYLSTEEAVSVELSGNVNSGVVSCSDVSGGASAGIIGVYNNAAEETSSYSLVITSCGNEGEVTSSYYTSGILAYTSATSYLSMSLTDCWNSGTVSGVTETGGILSWAPQNTTISGCYNSGVVTSSGYDLGGIVGSIDGEDVVLSDCWNVGEVSGTDDGEGAGGIVGFIATRGCTINGAFNAGTVSAEYIYVGGIVGRSYSTTVENAYNVGSVSGADYVAGVVGMAGGSSSDATSLVSVYNTGVVTASGTHYGNVASYSNSKYCVTESTYYLAANAYDTEEAGEALTYAELATLDLGDVWTSGDDYTYPRLTVIADNDYAKAYAAAVVPSGEDTYASITDVFYLGQPDGVVWSVDNDVVTIEDGCGSIDEDYDGDVTLTATSGDVSVQTVLHCSIVTGIGSVDANSREIVDERYYTLSGMEVTRPSDVDKSVYIIVRTYDDGTTSVVKQAR